MSAAQARRHSLAHAENFLWIFFRFNRIRSQLSLSLDECLELSTAHALRVNLGGCCLDILGHELGNHAHEVTGLRPGHGHQSWLTERCPRISEIAPEVLGKLIARANRPALRIARLTRLELGQLSASDLFSTC